MKKIIMLVSVILLMKSPVVKANSNSINWLHSFEDAKKMSKALNKPMLLDFTAYWCGPCKKMDSDVWSKDEVKQVMENFIPVKIDFDSERKLVNKYNVKGIPYIFIVDGWGNELYSFIGYRDKTQTLKILKNFSINMASIHQALTILEKSETSVFSNIRVAQKFQDVGFVVEGDAKKAFISRSNSYLKTSSKIAKKNIKVIQKIELLGLLNKAYFKSYKGTLKKLDKGFKNIDESNKDLYNYIQFYCNHFQENTEEADKYYQLINGAYKQKADYVLKQV